MLMVLVVHVRVRMLHGIVLMHMLVIFREMQPDADPHENACCYQLRRDGLPEE